MLERYILPLAPYVLAALNCALCVFFFLCLENEIRLSRKGRLGLASSKTPRFRDLKAKVEDLSVRLRDAEARAESLRFRPLQRPA